jgi:hypothetical protein
MNDVRAMLISDREAKIRDVLLKVRPPMASEQVLQAWSEGVAQGVTETMLSEADRIGKARAEDQQRLMHLEYAVDRYADGIREHRDTRGDDRCWRDDEALYKLLPEGFEAPDIDSAVELKRCEQFIACRQNPATEYVSPERMIEQLRADRDAAIQEHGKESGFWGRMAARLVAERNAARVEVERLRKEVARLSV